MSGAAGFHPRYSVKDYRQWKGDWELWDGLAVAMTPSPFGPHQAALAALLTELRVQIGRQACSATALSELDWIVSQDTVVRPDLIVLRDAVPSEHLQSPAVMIAEVLSESTRANDLTYKRGLYERQGVKTYLIIDPKSKTVQHLSLNPRGNYTTRDASARISFSVCEDCQIAFETATLFA